MEQSDHHNSTAESAEKCAKSAGPSVYISKRSDSVAWFRHVLRSVLICFNCENRRSTFAVVNGRLKSSCETSSTYCATFWHQELTRDCTKLSYSSVFQHLHSVAHTAPHPPFPHQLMTNLYLSIPEGLENIQLSLQVLL